MSGWACGQHRGMGGFGAGGHLRRATTETERVTIGKAAPESRCRPKLNRHKGCLRVQYVCRVKQ